MSGTPIARLDWLAGQVGQSLPAWHFATMTEPQNPTPAADFPPATAEAWRGLVDAVLKGAPFARLESRTYDGLTIEPLYPRDAAATAIAGRAPGAAWTVMQRVDHPDPAAANAQALDDLQNGASGLVLVFAGSVSANGFGLDPSPATLARALPATDRGQSHWRSPSRRTPAPARWRRFADRRAPARWRPPGRDDRHAA